MTPMMTNPQSDWFCQEVLDAATIEPSGKSTCDFCGTAIRWIHVLNHEAGEGPAQAGCCCAARLCLDYDAEGVETDLRNKTARRVRFTDLRKWKRSWVNPENIWRMVRQQERKVRVTVFMRDGLYSICLAGQKGQRCYFHGVQYAAQAEALTVAFELVERWKGDGSSGDGGIEVG